MIENFKNLLKDARKRDFYARWFVRLALFFGVMYLVFLKDTSRETVFVAHESYRDTLTILDYQLIEVNKRDTIIKQHKYEIIERNRAMPDDSLRASIIRAIESR